jgi:hypothetical protein
VFRLDRKGSSARREEKRREEMSRISGPLSLWERVRVRVLTPWRLLTWKTVSS